MSALGSSGGLLVVVSDKRTVAGAQGIIINFNGPHHIGRILVNEEYCSNFTDSDMRFILAHECSHIYLNHIISTLFWQLFEQWLKGENNEYYLAVEGLKAAFKIFSGEKLPPNAVTLRNQEYDADESAVNLTGDLNSAVECLKRLVGYDLNRQSHGWELFGNVVPAMTMEERIAELQRRFTGRSLRYSPFQIRW